MRKILISVLIISCITVLSSGAAWANSARTSWEGRDRAGLIVTAEDCPIIVEKELLTFDLQKFPANHYKTKEGYLSYNGKVTAEYTFRNPADYEVTATLAFPFGNEPDYAFDHDPETDIAERNTDTQKYDITVNGEKIERELRHTFSYRDSDFVLKDDLPRLVDGYVEDIFYTPDMPVTEYLYEISGIDEEKYPAASASFVWNPDNTSRKVFFREQGGLHNNGGEWVLSTGADNGDNAAIYIIGNVPEEEISWKLMCNDAFGNEKEIDGQVTLTESTEMTMKDFALTYWTEESGVSESDWYNAIITQFNLRDDGRGILSLDTYLDVSENLMRWYKYDITLGPGETVVNTVTAPIYPSINENKKPPVYGYTYLLSPAKTWADFGQLDIVINTPYYILESSLDGFEKTENGYILSTEGLPKGELEFTLCEEKRASSGSGSGILLTGLILAAGAGCFIITRRRNRKN